jgi:hypothetical protein
VPGNVYFEVADEVHRAVVVSATPAVLVVTRFNVPVGNPPPRSRSRHQIRVASGPGHSPRRPSTQDELSQASEALRKLFQRPKAGAMVAHVGKSTS